MVKPVKRYAVLDIFKKDPTGTTLIIQGRRRSGKSFLISIFVKVLMAWGFYIITNFQFTDQVFKDNLGRMYYIRTARQLLEAYTNIPEGAFIVLVLDDFQAVQGSKSTQVSSKEGDKFQDFSIFQGKLGISSIYITHLNYHSQAYTNQDPRYLYKFVKPFFQWAGTRYYDIRDKALVMRKTKKIPVPNIKPLDYIHTDIGFFVFDIDFKDLWDYMAKNRGKGNRAIIRDYLARDREKEALEELKGLSWDDIALAIAIKRPKTKGSETLYNVIPRTSLYSALRRVKELLE